MNDSKSQFRSSIIYLFARFVYSSPSPFKVLPFWVRYMAANAFSLQFYMLKASIEKCSRGTKKMCRRRRRRQLILVLCSRSALPFIYIFLSFFFFYWYEVNNALVCDPFLPFQFLSAIVCRMSQIEERMKNSVDSLAVAQSHTHTRPERLVSSRHWQPIEECLLVASYRSIGASLVSLSPA